MTENGVAEELGYVPFHCDNVNEIAATLGTDHVRCADGAAVVSGG